MQIFMMILLLLVLICLLIVLFFLFSHSKNSQIQDVLKEQENTNLKEDFRSIISQMQNLRKEQASSYQLMDYLSHQMDSMNRVMTNTKARGTWGEYQLEYLLSVYAGSQTSIYSMQYILENGKIADAILHLPNTEKVLCIDSKFPMENYLRKEDKVFQKDVKKHIDDISKKYRTKETLDLSILFLPSEAIYQSLCSSFQELIEYALKAHVLLCSPCTLVGIIDTLLASTKDFYRASHMKEIEKNILALQEDVNRLCLRSEKAERTLQSLENQFHEVSISANKLNHRMNQMIDGKEHYDYSD